MTVHMTHINHVCIPVRGRKLERRLGIKRVHKYINKIRLEAWAHQW